MHSFPNKPAWPFVMNRGSIQAKGLVGWWPGAAPGGTRLLDLSISKAHGTLTGMGSTSASGWCRGMDGGNALKFDQSNDYISIPSPPSLPGEMTIAGWVRIDSTSSGLHQAIWADTDIAGQYLVRISTANIIHFYSGYTSDGFVDSGSTTLAAARWYHVCITRSGSAGAWTLRVYLNGVLVGTSTGVTNNPPASPTTVRHGSAPAYGFYLGGNLDDTRYYNRPLSGREVQALYDPKTRWDLRYRTGLKVWSKPAAGGAAVVKPRSLLTLGCGC